jgi:hypothetical protein
MATFRYKVLHTKEYIFSDARFKSLVEEVTTDSYKLAETLIMLVADVFSIEEPNLDRVVLLYLNVTLSYMMIIFKWKHELKTSVK